MKGPVIAPFATEVAQVTAAKFAGIAVKQFAIIAALGHANAIVAVRLGREVANGHDKVVAVAIATDKRHHTVAIVVTVDPLKAVLRKVVSIEGRFRLVERVQFGHKVFVLLVRLILQQVPLQVAPDVPLAPLAKLHAHEQRLFARVGVHKGLQTPQVGELLPRVARHLTQHVALTVNHLIVGEGQHKVFAESIPNAEGDVVLMELAEPRIHVEIIQHVVHPAHVPLQVEAETANVGGPRHHRPRGGLLRNRERAREIAEDDVVGLPQKVCRFNMLTTAVVISHPLAVFAQVVELQHGSHGIHPHAIDMVFVKPK